jgi:hypothetical protein
MPVQIVKVTELTKLDAQGKIQNCLRVRYTVGEHGPFTEDTTKEEWMDGTAKRRMDEFAATLTNSY